MRRIPRGLTKTLKILDSVGTFPRRDSMVWSGKRSYLAVGFFVGIFIARLFSPLQWCKFFVRRRSSPFATDGPQQRADFHAGQTELYFMGVLLVLCALSPSVLNWLVPIQHLPPHAHAVLDDGIRVLAAILLIESFVWVLYYGSMRGFIEKEYTIYHRAEYILMVPLTFLVAAAAYSVLSQHSLLDGLSLMFDHADRGFTDGEKLLGHASFVLFFVVTVTYLVAQFPAAKIKADAPVVHPMTIIGAGDVVESRILPAVIDSGVSSKSIVVLTKNIAPEYHAHLTEQGLIVKKLDTAAGIGVEIQRERSAAVIATPTGTHLELMKAILAANERAEASASRPRIAIEKPLFGPGQFHEFVAVLNQYGEGDVFALSYYYLEKALPLLYLLTRERSYVPYLCYDRQDTGTLDHASFLRSSLKDLGQVRAISAAMLEGNERSPSDEDRMWIFDPAHGGIAYEMLIHLLMLTDVCLRTLPGPKASLTALHEFEVSNAIARERPNCLKLKRWPTAMAMKGRVGSVDIELTCGKYVATPFLRREMTITLERGTIHCDFDAQTARVEGQGKSLGLRMHPRFANVGYSVQIDLLKKFFANGFWSWTRTDGLRPQLNSLEWLELNYKRLSNADRLEPYNEAHVPIWMRRPGDDQEPAGD